MLRQEKPNGVPKWVARAEVGSNFVTVEGFSLDPGDVAQVEIADVEPYILGTRRFYEGH